jgi:class 3 adenylate cyclase/tetratricopeptide (TPR) repeat protein
MQICPTCQASNPDNARFCNQCGAKLAAESAASQPSIASYTPKHLAERIFKSRAAMQGERKRVTVLFADIKGSTKLAQEAGAELWHGVLDRFFSILSTAVHRYEGTVNQYTGDGVMALFGAPIAHEDDAQRACLAALEMQVEVRRYADELRLSHGLNLSMRVGLNTGEVIVGRIGDDLRMDYTAQGHTVNLAARMEHICEPGRVYLSRYTANLVEGYFKLRDLGRMNVAGVDEPIEVYELEGAGSLRTRLDRSLARGGSQFIGRGQELASLLTALDRVRAGAGQVLAVVGNAGIGKSRLCHEFVLQCERAGIAVHRATGVPYANALPLYPVQTLLRSRLGLPERAPAADVQRMVAGTFVLRDPANAALLPAVFDFLGAGTGVTDERAPDQAGSKIFKLFAQYLPSSETPQILLIEDLHFLDSASEEFIAQLCREIAASRTLLLVNYRPDYVSEWLIPFLDEEIAVSALTNAQLEQLASSLLGPHPTLAGIAAQIRQRASGNPFFVEEAVQTLAESGHLSGERGHYTLARSIDEWPIPDTVHALLAARIDRLPDDSKSLLQTAAVIGQQFKPAQLARLAEIEHAACEPQLSLLEDSGFVHQREGAGGAEYAFCHPLMQEVAYHGQLESRRAQAHARLAAQLEAQHPLNGPASDVALRIAHHWQRAGEWAKASAWNMQAARWAGGREMRTGAEHSRLAVSNADRAPLTPEVLRLRIAARSMLIRNSQFSDISVEDIDRVYAEGTRMAQECGDIACVAELMLSFANEQLHRGDADAAAQLAGDAVGLCIKHGLQPLIGRMRMAILLTHNAAGRLREGVQLVDAAGVDWRTRPVDEDNFMSRGFYGSMLSWLGRLTEAQPNLEAAIAYADSAGRTASWMHAFLVELAWFSGDYGRALPAGRQALQRAEEFGSPFFTALAARSLGRALNLHGRHAEAVPILERVLPLAAPGGLAHQVEANLLATLAEAYMGLGRLEQAHEMATAAVASAQRSHSRVWEIYAWLAFLSLPQTGPWVARVPEGLKRCTDLIARSGAVGFTPWLHLAQARWAASAQDRVAQLHQARDRFAAQGASAHVLRVEDLLNNPA